MAALAGIDQTLYEAAEIDGANRFQRILRVTIPGIIDTIMIMLILRIGQMLSVGYEKTILLYNPQVYETADILSSFIYRKGIQEMNYGYSTAVSLFNSVINFTLLIVANAFSRKYTETGSVLNPREGERKNGNGQKQVHRQQDLQCLQHPVLRPDHDCMHPASVARVLRVLLQRQLGDEPARLDLAH